MINNFSKDQVQKLALSAIGMIVLIYVYFSFFLGPLSKSCDSMIAKIANLQEKLGSSKSEMMRAVNLEQGAVTATTRYAAIQALTLEGAPIAWFPPRIKGFFANQQIDKCAVRLGNSTPMKEPELQGWLNHSWLIALPQIDFSVLGNAIMALENTEPLFAITNLDIHSLPEQPQFQQVEIVAFNVIQKK